MSTPAAPKTSDQWMEKFLPPVPPRLPSVSFNIKPRDPRIPLTPEEEAHFAARQKELFAEQAQREELADSRAERARERIQAQVNSPLGRVYTWFIVGCALYLVARVVWWIL